MKKFLLILFLVSFLVIQLRSQNDAPSVAVSAYVDCYYATDNDYSIDEVYSMRRLSYINGKKNQFGLNTTQINVDGSWKMCRSSVSLQFGDLSKTAYQAQTSPTASIQQAYIGVKLVDNLWIDAGYLLTHMGSELLLPKDNWLTSHSIVTYFEPFYQAGVRGSYETDKLTAQIYLLNGNGITDDNNKNKTIGLFLSYKPNNSLTISYANILGNEEPGGPESYKLHALHCIVASYLVTDKFTIRGQFDYGSKEITTSNVIDSNMTIVNTINGKFIGWSLTGHYQINDELSGTIRFADANNSDGVYTPIIKGNAITAGIEYKPTANSYIRLEGSYLKLDDKYQIFKTADWKNSSNRMEAALNFGIILK